MQASTIGTISTWRRASRALSLIPLLGCGSPGSVGTSAKGSGGASGPVVILPADSGAAAGGMEGNSSNTPPTDDANCGASVSDMSQQPADVLLVLDRSTSMSWDMARDNEECLPSATTCQQRWSTVTQTLDQILASSSLKIRWGLKLFATPLSAGTAGSSENCAVSPGVEVEVGAETAPRIQNAILATGPLGYTPTLLGLQYATQYLNDLGSPYKRYILLATDGEPNCDGASETTSGAVQVNHVIAQIDTAVEAGITVYVIGVGPGTNLRNLDKFAVAGGTEHYYPATSATELNAALTSIVGQVSSCTYALTTPPPDLDNIAVYLDKQIVPRGDSNGWLLGQDSRSVVFVGSSCEGIKAEKYKQVQVYYGCPSTQPPTVIP
jgi:hypothetical protein